MAAFFGDDKEDAINLDSGTLAKLERLIIEVRNVDADGRRAAFGRDGGFASPGRVEFHSHREYIPGDDIRHVDWNAYARLGRPLVKEYSGGSEAHIRLVLDRSASMSGAKFRQMRTTAAVFGFVALHSGGTLTVETIPAPTATFGPARGLRMLEPLIRHLESLSPAGGPAVFNRLRTLRGLNIILSDFWEAEDIVGTTDGELALVRIIDGREVEPPDGGTTEIEDSETGETVELEIDEAARAEYATGFERHTQKLESLAARRFARLCTLHSHLPVEDVVLRLTAGKLFRGA